MAVDSRKSQISGSIVDTPSLNNKVIKSLSASSSPSSGKRSLDDWSPKSARKYRSKEDETRRKQQFEAYQGWVNSQLKKLPGSRYIEDLQQDMRDGVALIQLVQVVAGDVLTVNENPTTHAEMRENVDRFLHFMAAKRIRMHRTTSKDIVDGNLKAIMRLILALAAHFKPASVKQAVPMTSGTKLVRKPSAAAAAQEAAAALADARGANASAGMLMRRHRHRPSSPSTPHIDPDLNFQTPHSKSKGSIVRRTRDIAERFVDGRTDSSGNTSGTATPTKSERSASPSSLDGDSEDSSRRSSWIYHSRQSSTGTWTEFSEEQDKIAEDIKDAKGRLLELQELLLNARSPCEGEESLEYENEQNMLESSSMLEQITILNARLDQRGAEYDSLKVELNESKEECLNLHGIKGGLEARHLEQDQIIMQLKAEVLRLNFAQDSSNGLITDLKKELKERDREIAHMRGELSKRDKLVERQKSELDRVLKRAGDMAGSETDSYSKVYHHEGASKVHRHHLKELQHRLDSVRETETDLSHRLKTQDQKMSALEERVVNITPVDNSQITSPQIPRPTIEEIEVIQESISNLRKSFNHQDPHNHTLDTLEQSISSILDQTLPTDSPLHTPKSVNGVDSHNRTSEQIIHRKSNDPISSRRGSEIANSSTKILYFTERTVTPFMTSIPKRLGEITLSDFKTTFDRIGNFRYHFQALDPEFGTVREEVMNNDDIVPGWEGKIIAWVEEDKGQKSTH